MQRGEIITEANEATERGFTSRELSNQLNLRVVLSLTEMIFKNPAVFRKFRVMVPHGKRHVRSPREYQIPSFRKGM
jgi:hypothetical protein